MKITVKDIAERKAQYPEASVVVHPECRPNVIDAADEALSTGGMIRYARTYKGRALIVGTETGILHRLKRENPGTHYVPVTEKAVCPNMKRIDLEKVIQSLEDMAPGIEIPEETRRRALAAVEKMLLL